MKIAMDIKSRTLRVVINLERMYAILQNKCNEIKTQFCVTGILTMILITNFKTMMLT